jgi:zinc finger RNA-binding protein
MHVRSNIHQKMLTAGKLEIKNTATKTTTSVHSSGSFGNSQSKLGAIDTAAGDTKSGNRVKVAETKAVTDMDNTISPDVPAVGLEYVDEFCTGINRTVTFSCKLCECKFSDSMGKVMHCKGRKHRVMYKKNVDPNFVLDIKSATSQHRELETMMRQEARNEAFVKRLMDEKWRLEFEQRRFEENYSIPPLLPPQLLPPMPLIRPHDTYNDQHVNAKHSSIYPSESELESIQSIVSTCEKCLKLISDILTVSDENAETSTTDKSEGKVAVTEQQRLIRGVMRVGLVSKGLLLRGDRNVELVILCVNVPTKALLSRIVDEFPKQLLTFTNESYSIELCVERSCFTVTQTAEDKLKVVCTITLTSPILREQGLSVGPGADSVKLPPPDEALDRDSCLLALAALRHAKWFQARANGLPSCVIVLRVLRDLRQRLPAWMSLSEWSLELLAEKCLSSEGGVGLSPGNALRRIFECIASGILLQGGSGLFDPCEKDPVDAVQNITPQQREDITLSAQLCLRKVAFRQIYKILGMDELPALSSSSAQLRNKRSLSAPDNGLPVKRINAADTA